MKATRFIGKVLPDGRLAIPKKYAAEVGKQYEVILIPLEEASIYDYTAQLARQKGFSRLSEKEVEQIIHESRGVK